MADGKLVLDPVARLGAGILMASLGLAKVPYDRWLRFMVPLFVMLMTLSAVFLVIAVLIGYS